MRNYKHVITFNCLMQSHLIGYSIFILLIPVVNILMICSNRQRKNHYQQKSLKEMRDIYGQLDNKLTSSISGLNDGSL